MCKNKKIVVLFIVFICIGLGFLIFDSNLDSIIKWGLSLIAGLGIGYFSKKTLNKYS